MKFKTLYTFGKRMVITYAAVNLALIPLSSFRYLLNSKNNWVKVYSAKYLMVGGTYNMITDNVTLRDKNIESGSLLAHELKHAANARDFPWLPINANELSAKVAEPLHNYDKRYEDRIDYLYDKYIRDYPELKNYMERLSLWDSEAKLLGLLSFLVDAINKKYIFTDPQSGERLYKNPETNEIYDDYQDYQKHFLGKEFPEYFKNSAADNIADDIKLLQDGRISCVYRNTKVKNNMSGLKQKDFDKILLRGLDNWKYSSTGMIYIFQQYASAGSSLFRYLSEDELNRLFSFEDSDNERISLLENASEVVKEKIRDEANKFSIRHRFEKNKRNGKK